MPTSSLAYFREVVSDPWSAAKKWKERTGGAVIGWLPADVPEEMILAAGALPVAVAGSEQTVTLADAHLPVWACSFARSSFELALRGELSFLDGVVIPSTCDTTRTLLGIWRHRFPAWWVQAYLLPHQTDRSSAREYLRQELLRLKGALERLTGQEITTARLDEAERLVSSCRALLHRLYDWHTADPGGLTSSDLYAVLRAATLLPKEDLLGALENLVRELNIPEALDRTSGAAGDKRRVFVSGSLAAPAGIFEVLERAGLSVVGDDLHNGYRYLAASRSDSPDPLERILNRQLNLPPTGYLNPAGVDRRRYLLDCVRRCRAEGVVFLHLRFCEPENYDYYDLNRALQEEGILTLRLETDFQGTSVGQLSIRLEAFAEMLGGGIDA